MSIPTFGMLAALDNPDEYPSDAARAEQLHAAEDHVLLFSRREKLRSKGQKGDCMDPFSVWRKTAGKNSL